MSGQGFDSFPVEGLGQADGVAAGLAEVGVVQQPVDGGGGQGFGHEFVEAAGVQVRRDGYGAAFVGGFDDAVEPFGGVGSAFKNTARVAGPTAASLGSSVGTFFLMRAILGPPTY